MIKWVWFIGVTGWFWPATAWAGTADVHWFDYSRGVLAAVLVLFTVIFIVEWRRAQKGANGPRAGDDGLTAVFDAINTAARKNRPVLFCPGLGSLGDPVTMATMDLLRLVATQCAEKGLKLLVPTYDPLTYPVAKRVVSEAARAAGRPDAAARFQVTYHTSRSFTFAAATTAMMRRERVGASFLFGHFYAESLLLSETGAQVRAVQISGSDSVEQLPFLVATSDRTLLGEELYQLAVAAGTSPLLLAQVRTSDLFKRAILWLLPLAVVLALLLDTALGGTLGEPVVRLLATVRDGGWR